MNWKFKAPLAGNRRVEKMLEGMVPVTWLSSIDHCQMVVLEKMGGNQFESIEPES